MGLSDVFKMASPLAMLLDGGKKNKNPQAVNAVPTFAAGASQGPNINANMAPPENFWQGDDFKIGAPGMQAVPPGQAPPQQTQPPPQMPPQQNQFSAQSYLQSYPDVAAEAQKMVKGGSFNTPEAYAQWHWNKYGKNEGRQPGGAMAGGQNPLMGGQQSPGPASPRIMSRMPPQMGGNMGINPLIGGKF